MNFQGRVVLVTGAAGGIGRPLCAGIGREGGHLALVDRSLDGLERLRDELSSAGIRCAAVAADVSDRQQLRAAIDDLSCQLGPVDILIAAAGICRTSSIENLRVAELEEIFRINFLGLAYAIEAVLPGMLGRRSGQIAGIVSLAAICPLPSESAYSASKAAAAAYLQSLRPALGEHGIHVTSIFPGFVRTPLLENLIRDGSNLPPGTVSAEKAAERILTAIRTNRRIARYPGAASWPARIAARLPPAAFDWIMTRPFVRRRLPGVP